MAGIYDRFCRKIHYLLEFVRAETEVESIKIGVLGGVSTKEISDIVYDHTAIRVILDKAFASYNSVVHESIRIVVSCGDTVVRQESFKVSGERVVV